jgi:hypothetical protein
MFAVVLWSLYLLLAVKNLPDLPQRVMISGAFGLLACLAVVVSSRYWRGAVVLASSVYLVTYVVLVGRMAMMVTGGGTSLMSALSFYYTNSWVVAAGTFHERGLVAGLAHGFLEYAMPVLSVVLIIVTLMSRRSQNASAAFR